MKIRLPLLLLAAALLFSAGHAVAKTKKAPTANSADAVATPKPPSPADRLSIYITNLNQLLSLDRKIPPQAEQFYYLAESQLVVLRQQFAAMDVTAPASDQPMLAAAAATCDRLVSALDERQQILDSLKPPPSARRTAKLPIGLNAPAAGETTQRWLARSNEWRTRILEAWSRIGSASDQIANPPPVAEKPSP